MKYIFGISGMQKVIDTRERNEFPKEKCVELHGKGSSIEHQNNI